MARHAVYSDTATSQQLQAGTASATVWEVAYSTGSTAPASPSGDLSAPWVDEVGNLPSGGPLWVSERVVPSGDWSLPRQVGEVP